MQLNKYDYKILQFVHKNEPVTKNQILRKFPDHKFATEKRLSILLEQKFNGRCWDSQTAYITQDVTYVSDETGEPISTYHDRYHATSKGKKAIQDYLQQLWDERKQFWFRSITVPILVSIPTAILTTIVVNWLRY